MHCECTAMDSSNYRKALPLQGMRSLHMSFQQAFRAITYSTFPLFPKPKQYLSQILGIFPSFCWFSQTILSVSSLFANWHCFPYLAITLNFYRGEWRWQKLCHGGVKPGKGAGDLLDEGKDASAEPAWMSREAPTTGSTSTIQLLLFNPLGTGVISVWFWEMTLASSRSGSLSLIQKLTNSKGGRKIQRYEVGMGCSLLPDPGALLNSRTFIRWHVFFCKFHNFAVEVISQRILHINHDNKSLIFSWGLKWRATFPLGYLPCAYIVHYCQLLLPVHRLESWLPHQR